MEASRKTMEATQPSTPLENVLYSKQPRLSLNVPEDNEKSALEDAAEMLLLLREHPNHLPEATIEPPKTNFRCPQCFGYFVSAKGLNQHIGKKHNFKKKQSTCTECGKKFRNKYAVKFHVQQVHKKATRVQCEFCGIQLYNKYMLKAHIPSCSLLS